MRIILETRFGIVGGLGEQAFSALSNALPHAVPGLPDDRRARPLHSASGDLLARKLRCCEALRQFEELGIATALLPCFFSHAFLDELQQETALHIVSLMDALAHHLRKVLPPPATLGILTAPLLREHRLFENHLGQLGYTLIYPSDRAQADLTDALYGPRGLGRTGVNADAVRRIKSVCVQLVRQGAQLCIPGAAELALIPRIAAHALPLPDLTQLYADFALALSPAPTAPRFRLGIIGGVGPAATVDFMQKLVQQTPAAHDQDHLKLLVDHNPQIPDRTSHLLGQGADPTIALFSAALRLQHAGVSAIAIPCNTAHAYVDRIQPALHVPIVHMPNETAAYIRHHFGTAAKVGLLATDGTLRSGVYRQAIGDQLLTPDAAHQQLVMQSIYGAEGAKAGFRSGACVAQLEQAMRHLQDRGADLLILGCTELPLLTPACTHNDTGRSTPLIDPGVVLAQACIHLAQL
jgi:aspartate racemase